jgi:sulfur carrier protein ThiS
MDRPTREFGITAGGVDSLPQTYPDAPSEAGVQIEYGANDISLRVAGHPVARVQRAVAQTLNVPPNAAAFVNGHRVGGTHILCDGDRLEFLREQGVKGALSPEELEKLDLPREVTTREAAQILDCDPKTVTKYIRHGDLEWRDIAAPDSSRPNYRITIASVLEMRQSYRRSFPQVSGERQQPQRRMTVADVMQSPHIRLNRR